MSILERPALTQAVEPCEHPHQPVVARGGEALAEPRERSGRMRQGQRVTSTYRLRRGGARGAPRCRGEARRAVQVVEIRQRAGKPGPDRPRILRARQDAQLDDAGAAPVHHESARPDAPISRKDGYAGLEPPSTCPGMG